MNIIRRTLVALSVAGAMLSCAHAQNLLQNPDFDSDLSGWDAGIDGVWTGMLDHSNPTATGGSLQISATAASAAQQCVNIRSKLEYVLDAWITKDPNPAFAPCVKPAVEIELEFWDEPDCSSQVLARTSIVQQNMPHGWFSERVSGLAPVGSHGARVKLEAACPAANAPAIVYFDDVSLRTDKIFSDGFDGLARQAQ